MPRTRKRNHPRPILMDTSRIEEVKTPQHDGTPRSRLLLGPFLGDAFLRLLLQVPLLLLEGLLLGGVERPARSISRRTRSERPRTRKDGVKAPPHDGTPRSYRGDFRHIVPSRWSFFFHSASSTACSRFFRNASSTSTRGLSSSSEAVVVVSMEVEVSFLARGEKEENENDRQAAKPEGVSPSSSVSAERPSRACKSFLPADFCSLEPFSHSLQSSRQQSSSSSKLPSKVLRQPPTPMSP